MTFSGCEKDQMKHLELTTISAHTISETRAWVECIVKNGNGRYAVSYGMCWSTNPDPTNETGIVEWSHDEYEEDGFTQMIRELVPNTTIYVRAVASHEGQILYGNVITFKTLGGTIGQITDIDGNIYNTVIIGEQVWMVENLKTTRYRNGDPISKISSAGQWLELTTGAFCYYDFDLDNEEIYGNLYNWYAVNDNRNIAPEGWHVPTDDEWRTLINHLIDVTTITSVGPLLRDDSGEYWLGWNNSCGICTNESGFTALPGGQFEKGEFDQITRSGYWWTSSNYYPAYPYYWSISCGSFYRANTDKNAGLSVRCLKD